MKEKSTAELDQLLNNMNIDEMDAYYSSNKDYLSEGKKAFYYYFKDVVESKNLRLKDIYSFAGLSDSYGGKIVSMEKHTKNRDVILRLCIAGHFTLEETNRALKLYGLAPLYSKDRRDACIIVAINTRKYSLLEIDDILEKQDLIKLSTDEK